MKSLTKFKAEAIMHLERFETYKDSPDEQIRRKVHCELDRFLMENRELVIQSIAKRRKFFR